MSKPSTAALQKSCQEALDTFINQHHLTTLATGAWLRGPSYSPQCKRQLIVATLNSDDKPIYGALSVWAESPDNPQVHWSGGYSDIKGALDYARSTYTSSMRYSRLTMPARRDDDGGKTVPTPPLALVKQRAETWLAHALDIRYTAEQQQSRCEALKALAAVSGGTPAGILLTG